MTLEVKTKPFDFAPEQIADATKETEVFRWIEWEQINPEQMTLPIDKVVMSLLTERVHSKSFHSRSSL